MYDILLNKFSLKQFYIGINNAIRVLLTDEREREGKRKKRKKNISILFLFLL